MTMSVCRDGCREELSEPRYGCNASSIYGSRGVGVSMRYALASSWVARIDLVAFLQCTSGASGIFDEC